MEMYLTKEVAVDLLKKMVQIDTTNALKTEYIGLKMIQKILMAEGIEAEVIFSPNEGRANLIAKIEGPSTKPSLIFLSHFDVVAAEESKWDFPPFSAVEAKGHIWGRGTLDTKHLTALHLMTFLKLAEKRHELNRSVYLMVTADEENGSKEGMAFIAQKYTDYFENSLVLSEGGGFCINHGPEKIMLMAAGEKATGIVKVMARGDSGHASSPCENQALINLLLDLNETLNQYNTFINHPVVNTFHSYFFKDTECVIKNQEEAQFVTNLYDYMSKNTLIINKLEVGDGLNVIPVQADAELEFRLDPNFTEESFKNYLGEVFRNKSFEWEITFFQEGYLSSMNDDIYSAFEEAFEKQNYKAKLIPFIALGKTDGRFISHYTKRIFGMSALDMPFVEVLNKVHQANESIDQKAYELASELFPSAIESLC